MRLKAWFSLSALALLLVCIWMAFRSYSDAGYSVRYTSGTDLFVPIVSIFLVLILNFHVFFDTSRTIVPLIAALGNLLLISFTYYLCINVKSGSYFLRLEPGFLLYAFAGLLCLVAAILHSSTVRKTAKHEELLDDELG